MKKVYQAENIIAARIMKDALHREGIPADIRDEHLSGALAGFYKFAISPSLWVSEEFAERALQIITQLQLDEVENSLLDWNCGRCGESNEKQYSECWSCRGPAPE